MTIKEGSEFPKGVEFTYVPYDKDNESQGTCGIPIPLKLDEELANKKVIIVAVPGAFTPTCSENHIPPFIKNASELKSKGVDEVIVISSNDPFVLEGWAKALGAYNEYFKFASDVNAKFSSQENLSQDLSSKGFGVRTKRFAIVVDKGKVTYIGLETGGGLEASGFEAVESKL